MDSVPRWVVAVVCAAAIVGLVLFARGPVDRGAHPAHPIAGLIRGADA
jgi:hypothetical protein